MFHCVPINGGRRCLEHPGLWPSPTPWLLMRLPGHKTLLMLALKEPKLPPNCGHSSAMTLARLLSFSWPVLKLEKRQGQQVLWRPCLAVNLIIKVFQWCLKITGPIKEKSTSKLFLLTSRYSKPPAAASRSFPLCGSVSHWNIGLSCLQANMAFFMNGCYRECLLFKWPPSKQKKPQQTLCK